MQQQVFITDKAITRVLELTSLEPEKALKLRVYIESGGCSGLQYGFAFEEQVQKEDQVFTYQAKDNNTGLVELLVDINSLTHLKGSTVDYIEDLKGKRFVIINNPNASGSCSCGVSFSCDK